MLIRIFCPFANAALARALFVLSGACAAVPIHAAYPERALRFIVSSPPGGANDILARIIGQKLAASLGQQVVIDNRAGAGGIIAAELAAKAPPDGHTLLFATDSTLTVNPQLHRNLSYNPERDFTPITITTVVSSILLAHPSIGVGNVKELIVLAKSRPGQLKYASIGNGSAFHLGTELFKSMAGIDMVHVPYKGSALSLSGMLAGEVQVMFISTPAGLPLVRAGTLRALAISSARRSPLAPDIPTIAESGLPGFEFRTTFAMVAPAGTPAAIVRRLNREVVAILGMTDVREKLATMGYEIIASTPEEMAAQMKREAVKWSRVIRESGAKAD